MPEPSQFSGLDPDYWQDPHTPLRAARECHPLARLEMPPAWLVLRHADAERLLSDPRLHSDYTGVAEGQLARVLGGFLVAREGTDHAHLRSLVARALTPRRIERARAAIRARSERLLAEAPHRLPFDFQRHIAEPLTVGTIAHILGLPDGDEEVFGKWTGSIMAGLSPLVDAGIRAAADTAAGALYDYLGDLAERRRCSPGDGLLDALIAAEADGHRLSPAELQDMVMSLLIGGHDTVRGALTSIAWLVLAHPGTLDWLGDDPSRAAATVEEALRFEPPLLGVPRIAVAPLQIGGIEIVAGEAVLLDITSANRDPRRFPDPDPDRFDPRREAGAHLAFGRGPHFCVGAALARVEAQELLLALASAETPRLAMVEQPRWVPFSPARRLAELVVRAEP